MKKVYISLVAEFIHPRDLKIIEKANDLGELTVGLLSDKAISSLRSPPALDYPQRKKVLENIKGVSRIVIQKTLDPEENLRSLKPDYIIHSDEWSEWGGKKVRDLIQKVLGEWGGTLIEIPLGKESPSNQVLGELRAKGTTPQLRLSSLKRLIESKPIVRIIEVHNGLCGLIAEKVQIIKEDQVKEFDGMWESSLTDSTSKGRPDNSSVDMTSRIQTIDQILDVTTKPIIVDGDNGGMIEHFRFAVRTLERLGVSAVIIEDKVGPKRNSLFGTDVQQCQDSMEEFSEKIKAGKASQVTEDFMIIARIESLILKKGQNDALSRAESYMEAGADGIMIHSKEESPEEILTFCRRFKELKKRVPLIVVPSTYSIISEKELTQAGVQVVIYANHLLRSAFPAMVNVARSILEEGRCHEASRHYCMPIGDILNLVPAPVVS